jgi:hypothetical protein
LNNVSYHFEPISTKLAARRYHAGQWTGQTAIAYLRLCYRTLLGLRFEGGLRLCDKTPQAAFLVPALATGFPNAQFIHIVRDGRDSAVSYSKKPWLRADSIPLNRYEPGGARWGPYARFWTEPERIEEFRTTTDLHRCIWAWRCFTESAIDGGRCLGRERWLELRYEQLVSTPDSEGRRIAEFLGEARQSGALARALSITAHTESVGRWLHASTDEQETMYSEAGHLLRALGYAEQ